MSSPVSSLPAEVALDPSEASRRNIVSWAVTAACLIAFMGVGVVDPILPDIGMLASFDPVALDQACADLCNKQQPQPNSMLGELPGGHKDHFHALFSETNWEAGLAHAEKIGLGTRQYELVTMR